VQQLAATECGAACLAMVLGYHGKNVRLDELRDLCSSDRDGVNALAILDAARAHGLIGRGVRLDTAELHHLDPGSILHWELNHFVVFETLRDDAVDVIDPATGRRRVSMEDFRKSFTGVALLLEPSDDFEERPRTTGQVWRYVRRLLAQSRAWSRVLLTSIM